MKLTPQVKAIRARFVAKFGLPQGGEEVMRSWSLKLAQQVRFDTADKAYGVKKASDTRPQCKDCLAYDGHEGLIAWDMLEGAGTGNPTLAEDPDSISIPDQVFIPVLPIDYLGATTPPVQPPQPTPVKTLNDYFAITGEIRTIYKEELNRDVLQDPQAIANWTYHWREHGKDAVWIREQVRESEEWHDLHP